jgi:hypothetical protein
MAQNITFDELYIKYRVYLSSIARVISSYVIFFLEGRMSTAGTYEIRAKNILKAELKRRGITYAMLAELLAPFGVNENERNLANKISRGSFTTAFFLMCMDAIGVKNLALVPS